MPEESTTPGLEEANRRFIAALGRRDFDAAVAVFAPNAVWETSGFEGAFEGRQAIRGLLEDFIAPYEDYGDVSEQPHDLGNDVILNVPLVRGRPKLTVEGEGQ
jgi:ketosteroid isomerase-like protein